MVRPLVAVLLLLAGCSLSSNVLDGRLSSVDDRACAEFGRSYDNKTDAYRGCMIARGYNVYVTIPTDYPSNSYLQFEVQQQQGHEAAQAVEDLSACRKRADDAQAWAARSRGEKVATVIGGLGGAAAGMGIVDRQEGTYKDCLADRGYAARRYAPR